MSAATDIRAAVARYYDFTPQFPNDIPYYRALIASPQASVLELGCGTGRVLLQLAQHCAFIQGIDRSESMLAICREKIRGAKLPAGKTAISAGDISHFELGRTFDLIIAPWRVLQNLETDAQLDGLFACIRRHLAPRGSCVLNVFKPKWPLEELLQRWLTQDETFAWEVPLSGGRLTCHDRRQRLTRDPLVLYPELVWRRFEGEALVDEVTLEIPMRCYYADEFATLVTSHGFRIVERRGGYAGEPYGEGPELVLRFGR
ncbi:MAG TPA: class I SAM-dependent methyltransferase [Burkholderiales bacterium]|nr:class I SAM-dependent methyltransferase [Burkholderiales bacterium]